MVVEKLNPATTIKLHVEEAAGETLVFEGEEHDLQEILGNLIENSAKYAKSAVRVRLAHSDDSICIDVEDDGSGMSAEQMNRAMKRGGRVDEGKTGWGLGLSIVGDIVDEYSGVFELAKSEMGGLRATVKLPGRKELE